MRLLTALFLIIAAAMMAIFATTDKKNFGMGLGIAALFGMAGLFTWPRRPNAWRREPPTERQISYARDLGIRIPRGISKGELSDLITEAKANRDEA